MIVGIGIDIVKIEKMEKAIARWGDSFIDKIFNPQELESIMPGKVYLQRLAARFAAKEAVIKAISQHYPLSLKDILIFSKENGAPYCTIRKKVDVEVLISMTHIEDYAVATAIAQKKA